MCLELSGKGEPECFMAWIQLDVGNVQMSVHSDTMLLLLSYFKDLCHSVYLKC